MYQEFFSLKTRPFPSHGATAPFIPTPATGDALPPLERCAREGRGIAVLSAPEGTGKTAVVLELGRRLAGTLHVVYLSSSNYASRRGLLQAILFELGVDYAGLSEHEARLQIIEFARNLHPDREGLVLLVDEADQLSERLLEELRTLANYMHDGRAPLRLVLCGQLALDERLATPELHAVNQRVGCHVVLEPLDRRTSAAYVRDALAACGAALEDVFSPEAIDLICVASDGNVRCLHHLCDHALLLAFVAEEKPVSVETVRAALADLQGLPLNWNVPASAQFDGRPQTEHESFDPAEEGEESHPRLETAIDVQPDIVELGTTVIEFGGDSESERATTAKPAPAVARDREYRLEDRYAELDRLAELDTRDAESPATVVTSKRSPGEVPAAVGPAPDHSFETPLDGAAVQRTIEEELLARIADMRTEVRHLSSFGDSVEELRESTARCRPLPGAALDEAIWDVIQPESGEANPTTDHDARRQDSLATEDDGFDEPDAAVPIPLSVERCDAVETLERRPDSHPATDAADGSRRYAFLFTRLRDRRRDLAERSSR